MKGETQRRRPRIRGRRRSHRFGLRRQLGAARRSQVLAKKLIALEPRCDPQSSDAAAVLQADAGRVRPLLMITPGTAASRCIFW